MEVRGDRSSRLTISRNSARDRPGSPREVRSCRVTTTEATTPSSDRMGVALTKVETLRPSGTRSTNSSARTVSAALSTWDMGNSFSETSIPSARRKDSTSSSCSGVCSGSRRPSTSRRASRLKDTGVPVRASNTTTPTGAVLTRVSRPALACCSSRWRRALAMASAAWEANSTRVSSSPWLNSSPPALPDR